MKRISSRTIGLVAAGLGIALLITLFSPLASSSPDGLERVAEDKEFINKAEDAPYKVIADYAFPWVENEDVATVLAGIVGVLIVAGCRLHSRLRDTAPRQTFFVTGNRTRRRSAGSSLGRVPMSITLHLGERYLPGQSLFHRLDARTKVVGTLAFVFAVSLTPVGQWPAFGMLALIVVAATAASRLSPLLVLRRSALALPFLIVAVPLLFTKEGMSCSLFRRCSGPGRPRTTG